MTGFGFPYRVGADGRTGFDPDRHVRGMIELVLFTNQGERVNRPDFGANVPQLVFSENSPELATALQHLVMSALQRWLGERIEIRGVEVEARAATLAVQVRFRPLDAEEERVVRVVREG